MLTSNFGLLIKLQIAILKQQAIHLLILICILINASAVIAGPAEDTETLLNWAESTYPQLFPSHQATQSSAPWLYRFYPEAQVYAGVNTSNNGVYVLGGPWGNAAPTYIDSLSNLIAQAGGGKLANVASLVIPIFSIHSNYALKKDGTVWGWGGNKYGSIGDGTQEDRSIPVKAANLDNVVDLVTFSGATSAALKSDRTVWAWGWNLRGDVGNEGGTVYDNELVPIPIAGLDNVKKIGVTPLGFYAIKNDGTLWVWGCQANQILTKTLLCPALETPYLPTQISAISDVKEFYIMSFQNTINSYYVIKNDGTLWTWGNNLSGQLGDGTTIDRETPAQMKTLTNVVSLHFGLQFTPVFALLEDGTVWAWGENNALGITDALRGDSPILKPTQVKNLTDITKISISLFHRLALKKDGTVWVWGNYNLAGELGNGKRVDPMVPKSLIDSLEPVPVQLPTISGAIDIGTEAGFGAASYALTQNGEFLLWGTGLYKDGRDGAFIVVPTLACSVPGLTKMYNSSSRAPFAPYLLNNDGTILVGYADGCVRL